MYFARHGRDRVGDCIRMAWAERIEGPWHLFHVGEDVPVGQRGVLDLGSNGASLRPPPPVASKQKDVRYLHLHEDEPVDEQQLARWIRQAADLPGEELFREKARGRGKLRGRLQCVRSGSMAIGGTNSPLTAGPPVGILECGKEWPGGTDEEEE
jgi:hypothetical protein